MHIIGANKREPQLFSVPSHRKSDGLKILLGASYLNSVNKRDRPVIDNVYFSLIK